MAQEKVRTIYDLAALAGVSAATVSRALAGKDSVKSATANRIRKLAEQHGFEPSMLARNLRTRRSSAIRVVIPLGHERTQHVSDPFFMKMIGYLADELMERGYELLLTRVIPERPDWLETLIKSAQIEGLIVIGQSDQLAAINAAAQHYLPMVVWGGFTRGQGHCSVGTDNYLGGRMAMSHLIERGCRHIAFLGNKKAIEIRQRMEGARSVLAESSGDVTLMEIPTHLSSELSATDVAGFLDNAASLPDGVFAASDMIALTAMQAFASRGLSVPKDVRIVGFDDLPIAQYTLPPLTTIRQDIAAGASQLVDCLFKRIEGMHTGSIVLNPELVVRGST